MRARLFWVIERLTARVGGGAIPDDAAAVTDRLTKLDLLHALLLTQMICV